jgi:hypothetical protein
LRWTAFHHIDDKHLFALQANCFQHGVEQLTRSASKGLACRVFICTGGITDDHPRCLLVACPKDRLSASAMENALSAAFHRSFECRPIQCCGL